MKRTLVLGVAAGAALTLALAGCSSSKPAATTTASQASSVASSAAAPASSAGSPAASSAGASSAAGSPAGSAAAAPTKAKKDYKISFIQGVAGDNFYITMQCGIQDEAKKLGVTVNTQGATKFDPTLQTPILDSVVSSKPDAILIAPTDVKAMQAPLQKAAAAGIKIVLVDTTVNDPSFAVSQVSSDNLGGGKAAFDRHQGAEPQGRQGIVHLRRSRHLHH